MKTFRFAATGLLFAACMYGQQADIGKTLDSVSTFASRLAPMLDDLRPKEWVAKGAPDTYVTQWTSSLDQCKGLSASAKELAQHPDKLPDVLQLLFRIQSLDITTGSLEDGLRRYQNPALADLLSAARAESTPVREKLQQYALELAEEKDRQFQVMDKEAQRCRQDLSHGATKSRPDK